MLKFVSCSITNTTATVLSLIHYKICIHTTGNSLEDFVITAKLVDTLKANVGYLSRSFKRYNTRRTAWVTGCVVYFRCDHDLESG